MTKKIREQAMPTPDFIIQIYLMVDDCYHKIVTNRLRQGGYTPKLTDSEVITMEIVGEFLQMDTDSLIHQYFKSHWQAWFPNLGSYPNFAKQCANLLQVKTLIQQHIVKEQGQDNIHFIDGFPIPVCQYTRAYRHQNFKGCASFSYCPSKQEKYYGFEGHLVINLSGMITHFTFASACVDEREVAPDIVYQIYGMLGADKGYISPSLKQTCLTHGIDLQTPLRKNMTDDRPKSVVNRLKKARRNIETVIGQLSERFNIQKVRARDLWHLSHRLMRKILAHNFCFILNKQLGNPPLQFELLVRS